MDFQLYFPDEFGGYIHAPVPLYTQAFDVDAYSVQENDATHPQVYATFPQTQAPPTVVTFPTPSELMVDLASDSGSHNRNMTSHQMAPLLEDLEFMQAHAHPGTIQMNEMSMALGMGQVPLVGMNEGGAPDPMMPGPVLVHPGTVTVEPARKAKRRATTTSVSATHGSAFVSTDP
jgi:hypothetical protein